MVNLVQSHSEMVTQLESPPKVIVDQVSKQSLSPLDAVPQDFQTARLLHAGMGCVTESGELMDQLKRHIVYGKPIDLVNFQEELGDMLWYIQLACLVMGVTLEELLEQNMRKLRVRFGDKFDFGKVLDRDLAAERQALEGSGDGAAS